MPNPTLTPYLQSYTLYPASTWYQHVYQTLATTLPSSQETQAITTRLLAHYLDYTPTKHVLGTPLQADSTVLAAIYQALQRLSQHEPLQYILGQATFLQRIFKVDPHVFIPRQETEEMVHYITQQPHRPTRILDLGTGSGCVAISLQKHYPQAEVHALDLDSHTLGVAQQNATKHEVNIHFHVLDLLRDPLPPISWDLMVSNPPYVPVAEKKYLSPNVGDYEPHQALFVPNDNPLLFYQCIAELTQQYLACQGTLYVEIHENLSQHVARLFQQAGLKQVHIHQDLHGKNRWISCQK